MEFALDQYFPDESQNTGDAGRASFNEKRPLYLVASKRFIGHYREQIRLQHVAGASGAWTVQAITAMTDKLICRLFTSIMSDLHQAEKIGDKLVLAAVGGYGRGELNPFSDIDLMFLHSGIDAQLIEEIAQKLLYFLWDMRLEVGYSVRTIPDCVEMARADSTVRTALLDSRYMIGSQQLFKEFEKVRTAQILMKGGNAFIREKVEELKKRREKYGASVYLLEPNIKEGEGGLRDLHSAMWVSKIKFKIDQPRELIVKGVLSEEELDTYYGALDYLWRIRNELHYRGGRKSDQLTFDAQIHLAAFFGYTDRGKVLAVEEFMRDYYLHATKVEHFSAMLIARSSRQDDAPSKILGYFIRRPIGEGFYVLKGELVIPDETIIQKDPARLMKIFEYAQKQGVELNIRVKTLVRKNLDLVNDKFRRNKEVNASFFKILRAEHGVVETLTLMHHLEFLNRFIPEFERIYCKVQHDLYHIYTVDIHSLFCVEEIVKLWHGEYRKELPALTTLAGDIHKRELLLLAVLLHDIGKGEGGGHADKGADLCRTIARRLGLSKEDSERLDFLVRSHLLFAHIAQRRDLHDERMIVDFARQMQTSENLKMLYLLTFADIKGVGPDVWTEWKEMLLHELYEKTYQVLERGDFRLEASSERARKVKRKVLELLENEYPAAQVREELKALTTRHVLSHPPELLADHLRILLRLDDQQLIMGVAHEPDKSYSNFTIATHDVPGLFAMITGVMAANGINILGAQIHTSKNGKALDILQVNSPQGFVITEASRWQRVEDDMRRVLAGEVQVDALVQKRRRPTLLAAKVRPRFPTRVEIDNEVSVDYTVLDIYTHDQIGLLYRITSTLKDLGLYIGVAKISTKVDQVADVFYVKDIFSHKITAEDKLEEIRRRLLSAIDEEPSP